MNISNNKWFNFFVFKNSLKFLMAIVVCLIIAAYLGARTPTLITGLSQSYSNDDLFFSAIQLLLINFTGVYINRVSYQLLVNKYVRMLIQNARVETYTKWIKAPELEVEKYPQGEIISRIMSDTEAIRELITSGAFGIFIDLSFVLSCLFGFIKIHPFSGYFLSFAELIATILLIWGSSLMRDMFMKLRNSQAKVNRVTANIMGGFAQTYYTRHENYSLKKSVDSFDEFLANQHRVNSMDAFYYAIAESLYPILLALVVIIFPYSKITEAALIFAIVDLIQRSIGPIKEISGKIANIQRARAGIDRIASFIEDTKIETSGTYIADDIGQFQKLHVKIDHFEYKKREDDKRLPFSLSEILFEGKKGDMIGIVGLSGCGKSTLLNILSGNLKAPAAQVEVHTNKNKISIHDVHNYQKEVSLVSQESHIFTETLKFNITMSYEEDSNFESRFKFFQEQIPYLKVWGIKGNDIINPKNISLGQRQLLAGIRAMYLNKDIVFFDEISSALDPELELALRNMVLMIQKNSLTIIVAHRIETIMSANKILVMENGRIISSGIHSELMHSSDTYKKFIEELSHS